MSPYLASSQYLDAHTSVLLGICALFITVIATYTAIYMEGRNRAKDEMNYRHDTKWD